MADRVPSRSTGGGLDVSREQLIDWIAERMWLSGLGNKKGGRIFVERLVDELIEKGVLNVRTGQ